MPGLFGMTPEMWEAIAAMECVATIDPVSECCICGDDIDADSMHLVFMDMLASAHISCADKLLGKLEERFYT